MAFGVRYIQVTRSAEVGTDGLHATVQAFATLRSLNWPDNYDELSSPEQKAVRAVQDQKMTEYCLANISAANEEDAATVALINAGPAGTTTNSTYPRQGDEAWHRGIASQPN